MTSALDLAKPGDWIWPAFALCRAVIEGAPASEQGAASGRLVGFLVLERWGGGIGADLAQALALTVKAATSYPLRDQKELRENLQAQARSMAATLQTILRLQERGKLDPLAAPPGDKK